MGGFPHWLYVSVDGAQYRVAVMHTRGDSLPADAVRRQDRSLILAARQAIDIGTVHGRAGGNFDGDIYVSLKNRRAAAVSGRLAWHVPDAEWKFDRTWGRYNLSSYGETKVDFHVRTTTPAAFLGAAPRLSVEHTYGNDARAVELTYGLPVVRNMEIPPAARRVVADGRLDEWEGIEPLALVNQLGSEPASEDDLSASVRMMWSPKRFYVALEVKDDITTLASENAEGEWDVDNFSLTFDPFVRDRHYHRGSRYEYLGFMSTKATRLYLLSDPVASGQHRPASNVELGVMRRNGTIIYELIFDDASLSPLALQAGEKFAMNVLVGDDDGPRQPEEFTLLALAGKGATPYDPWPHIVVTLKP
ncbi:MAG: hypothetical protein GTO55_00065 [Armatimonadetes bacterium]|nr:hypothetical protein [Armatimonadota bacterium]NIM66560.1 hypothetical protein [Armatimonadota bacterium]NIM75097.1 hypothetical protein [Armatimonadota bacterium]NIN04780.1 hypothetical protein [Armatimonadota bacterium]NIO74618.1 hypothetical protein [Armatimonadota bacterium]